MLPSGPSAARLAGLLAFAVPAALLGGAYVGEYLFGLYPCEMCWWQRYPHFVALALAILALLRPPARPLVALAGLALIVTGLIGAFHAGVEYKWWEGLTACSTSVLAPGVNALEAILDTPLIRCDQVQWELFGISLAGYNFLISVPAGLVILRMLARSRKAA